MLTIDALRAFGANVDEGLHRCMNNEAFYLRMVGMALADAGFAELGGALEKNDLDAAFEASHKLKGALGNLSLDPIFEPTSTLCELLRSKTPGDYAGLYQTILQKRDELAAI